MKTNKKAIIYNRVATTSITNQNESLENQSKTNQDYCKKQGIEVVEIINSCSSNSSKELKNLIAKITNSDEPIIFITSSVDRLQRQFGLALKLDGLVKLGKLELHFPKENLIINSNSKASDIFRWDISIMFARTYSQQISENVKRALEYKKKLSTSTTSQVNESKV